MTGIDPKAIRAQIIYSLAAWVSGVFPRTRKASNNPRLGLSFHQPLLRNPRFHSFSIFPKSAPPPQSRGNSEFNEPPELSRVAPSFPVPERHAQRQ